MQTKKTISFIFFVATLVGSPFFAHASGEIISPVSSTVPQGGVAVFKLAFPLSPLASSTASFDGKQIPIFPYHGAYRAVAPIPATTKTGPHTFTLTTGETKTTKSIKVSRRIFPSVGLPVPKKLGLSAVALTLQLGYQKKVIDKALTKTDTSYIEEPFELPLPKNSRIASQFGEIRFTEGTSIRHLGVDIAALAGTPVMAINGGIVTKTYIDPVYGNVVILSHGGDIYSLYMHLQKIQTKEGAVLQKGDILGTVGTTGYSTAPHLHLSVKIGGEAVDPLQLIKTFK